MFRPELKDPVNAVGAILASIGGLGLFTIFCDAPEWLVIAALILWAIGICILFLHTRNTGKKQ